MAIDQLTITRPDDWHLHLRDGDALAAVAGASAAQFARAIVMPNLKAPVTTVEQARAYRERVLAALPAGSDFEPLMTLYLTDNTSAQEIRAAAGSGFVHGVKLYPAGATTNSDAGVTDIRHARPALEAMQAEGVPLLVHGEVTDREVDVFDREKAFIDTVMIPLRRDFPALRVVFEHITTLQAAQYVRDADEGIGATITAHHLLYNRNAIFAGGLASPLVLPAGAQARGAPSRAARGRHGREPALLPRHRQRAARPAAQGARRRLRRLLHRAARTRALRDRVRRGGRARCARGVRQPPWPGVLSPAGQRGHRDAAARALAGPRVAALSG